jgi:hypothetical protein
MTHEKVMPTTHHRYSSARGFPVETVTKAAQNRNAYTWVITALRNRFGMKISAILGAYGPKQSSEVIVMQTSASVICQPTDLKTVDR